MLPARAARTFLVLIALAATVAVIPIGNAVNAAQMSREDYEACQTNDEPKFRKAVETIIAKALTGSVATVEYTALVSDHWRDGNVDQIIDDRVDLAVSEVRDETSWGNLIKSLGSKDTAQELATAVAERVYRSEAMKAALETLAAGVAHDIGRRLELATSDAASPALSCLEAYLGPRYGNAVASFVTSGDATGLTAAGDTGGATVTSGDVLQQSKGGITGVALLVLRRQMANLARRLGQRLVGTVLSRIVSTAAGGIGLVLIAKDIWDLRHGVLPIIADEMKSPLTKQKVREELATALSDQIREHVGEIAEKSSEQVVEVWQTFRRAHAKVLELAETNEPFKKYLNGLAVKQLPRLDAVVALILAEEGTPGIIRRLDNGTLDQAVLHMPPAAMEIAGADRSLETGLKWQAVAGDRIDAVVANEIYRRAKPDDFSSSTLARLLALDDRLAISRLAGVSRSARDALFELDGTDLTKLARSLSEKELATLASYLSGLQEAPRERVLKAVASEPATLKLIAPVRVRDAVVSSRDQLAAVDMMLRPQGVLDPVAAYEDMVRAWQGRVKPQLVWEKHPVAVVMLALVALFLLMVLRRLVRPHRPHTKDPDAGKSGPTKTDAKQTTA
ncbi:MAG: hypothetical protein KDJ45_03210 [Hyphomicrobiaceae bacterium]|nr:hypothetical protein [Hyphomicrobiaceae bacterium]